MPEISWFYGLRITMNYNDHHPRHFHVDYGDDQATIDIDLLALHDGYLPKRALRMVLLWAKLHQAALLDNWERCRASQPLAKVPPLE
jgi:hypothetical protein